MKKIVYVLLILTLLFAFAACAKTGSEAETTTSDTTQTASTTSAPEVETEPSSEHKAVVIYFSRAGEQYGVGTIEKGNTKIVAEMIADKTGADLFEIEPTDNRYDLSYDDLTDYAKKEQADNARPEYKGSIDLSPYDVVYLGYPIWWGDLPITVTYQGKTTTFIVTVNASTQGKVKSVSADDITMNYKASTTIKPKIDADDGVKYTVKYESSNPKIASVDENGNVKALKKGNVTITVTVTDQYGNVVKDTHLVNEFSSCTRLSSLETAH